jgi:hypothetical protein
MKFTNVTKGLLAASALTLTSFANAGAIATAEFEISGFGIYSAPGVLLTGIDIGANDYFGSSAATGSNQSVIEDIFGPSEVDFDQDGLGYENFNFSAMEGLNSASINFVGTHLSGSGPVPPTGTTFAHAEVSGTGSAGSTAILENSAKFTWDNGNATAGESVLADFSYAYALNLIADSTNSWEQGTAEAFGSFIVQLIGTNGSFQNVFDVNVSDQDLSNIATTGTKSKEVTLFENVRYTLKVIQTSDVDVRSVAEPTTIAMLGLGLLGFAGVSRRRKS